MVSEFEVPLSKALVGSIAVHYAIYAVLYIIEGCMFQKLQNISMGGLSGNQGSGPDVQQVY